MTTNYQKYKYSGPLSSITLRVDGKDVDVLLNPKRPVTLPPDHEYAHTLLALKRLTPIKSDQPAQKAPAVNPAPKAKDKEN